ncbi:MAG: succinate dehydrogenase/fumarate reductase iron-sulfur subunit, partial [Proteobacteria bacterium]|nr:succinate dehydrogenase/fumarate reductase iron-sulfur subunit [Pseudomonadota bacterium]
MKLNLKIWRQKSPSEQGQFKDYVVNNANEDMSFLEMLDFLNMDLVRKGE